MRTSGTDFLKTRIGNLPRAVTSEGQPNPLSKETSPMPLPNDQRVVALANEFLQVFDTMFGLHPGYRAAHAKGVMLAGAFTPATGATALTRAPHVARPETPVTVRFSNSTGLPELPDNVADANPRGLAIRFNLAEHVHTDIVSHSIDAFPTRDGYEFLEFLRAAMASGPGVPSPKPVEKFLGAHPAALAFVQAPKPFPASFATETYYGVTAFEFINGAGQKKFGRYRIVPEAGNSYLTDAQVAGISATYHFDEIAARVAREPVQFQVRVQVAAEGDVVDNATIHWPESRQQVDLGTIELTEVLPDSF